MREAFYADPATEYEVWDDDDAVADSEFPLLYSTADPPNIRSRLHVICVLYTHAETLEQRMALLDQLEALALEAAAQTAVELLEGGWRPDISLPPPPLKAVS